MKTVGVVIPIYNVEKYLRECLDSVVNQTYKNLQVVLVNDGSTDENSLNIAKEYTLKDERFILFDKENGGLSSSRNVGIEFFSKEYDFKNIDQELKENSLVEFKLNNKDNSYNIYKIYKSSNFFKNKDELLNFKAPDIDYIIFLDSDDYWELNCIEECVPRMDGVEVVWFDHYFDYDDIENSFNQTLFEQFHWKKNQSITSIEWLQRSLENNIGWFAFAWSGMIDFIFLKKIKLKFIDKIIWEDQPFGIILFAECKNIYLLIKKLYYYRIRKNSISDFNRDFLQCPKYMKELYFFDIPKNTYSYFLEYSKSIISIYIINYTQKIKNSYIKYIFKKNFYNIYLNTFYKDTVGISKDPLKAIENLPIFNYQLINDDKIEFLKNVIIKDYRFPVIDLFLSKNKLIKNLKQKISFIAHKNKIFDKKLQSQNNIILEQNNQISNLNKILQDKDKLL
ncbi:TPA: glycosyltransferase family 2 protein, partial [Campylobacter coli]|nr:glycosyltransferase family 2 protein [Campylobacter coli]